MKKRIIGICFILFIAISLYLIVAVLKIKSPHGINQQEGLYWQPKDKIDVVMMGSSHVHCNINTGLLWEKYGMAAYDYSGAEQPLWMTYYFLQEVCKYQSPKVVVLDMFAPAKFKEDYQYVWISENILGMRFSKTKLDMLSVSVERSKLPDYFPSFFLYHSRYDKLNEGDFEKFFWDKSKIDCFKGYTPYFEITPQKRPEFSTNEVGGLSEKSLLYLNKIIDYTKKNQIELIMVVSPYMINREDKMAYNQMEVIAEENNVAFIDYNEYYTEMGLDFSTDINDESHLNYWGSCKYTDYLGQFLSEKDTIPNRKAQDGYESWDKNVEQIYLELEQAGKR